MGESGEDVQLSPQARKSIPFTIECKSRASIAVYSFFEQAEKHKNFEPVVFIKANRKKPLAIIDAEKFIEMVKKYSENIKHK